MVLYIYINTYNVYKFTELNKFIVNSRWSYIAQFKLLLHIKMKKNHYLHKLTANNILNIITEYRSIYIYNTT